MCGFGACTEFLVVYAAPSSSPQVCAVFAVLRAHYFRVPRRAAQKAGDATDGRRYVVAVNLGADSIVVRCEDQAIDKFLKVAGCKSGTCWPDCLPGCTKAL
ncbi:hypothetical protein WJX82_003675 [Trebouxia sp. C0006]